MDGARNSLKASCPALWYWGDHFRTEPLHQLVPTPPLSAAKRRSAGSITRSARAFASSISLRSTSRTSGKSASETITSASSIEVQRLVEQFNSMSRQLSETYEDLRGKNEQLELVMAGANDGIWDWDIEHGTAFVSPRWKSMLGYGDDEITNIVREWKDLIHPDDYQRSIDTINDYLAGNTTEYRSDSSRPRPACHGEKFP